MSEVDLAAANWRVSSYTGGNEGSCVEVAAVWRISSRSASKESDCVEVAPLWQVSSRSGPDEGTCVEVAAAPSVGLIATRDSKDRTGPVLTFSHPDWAAFLSQVKSGSYG